VTHSGSTTNMSHNRYVLTMPLACYGLMTCHIMTLNVYSRSDTASKRTTNKIINTKAVYPRTIPDLCANSRSMYSNVVDMTNADIAKPNLHLSS